MHFASDNTSGICPEIMNALAAAAGSYGGAYAEDPHTQMLDERFAALFETEVRVFPVATGTAANSLALATLAPPWGTVLCHHQAHVIADEAGAPEFFASGARLVGLPGRSGKLDPAAIGAATGGVSHGVHSSVPSALTLTQATEAGTVYTTHEVAALAAEAHARGLAVHMDGARFANAVVATTASPADLTWRAGVDVLSFGATKNGALAAEAVVYFDRSRAVDFERHRKRSGHLLSKTRYLSVQLLAYVADDLWLRNAAHANNLAARLSTGLAAIDGITIIAPTQANEVFASIHDDTQLRLREAGAEFHPHPVGEVAANRMVCSWSTTLEEVDRFVEIAADA